MFEVYITLTAALLTAQVIKVVVTAIVKTVMQKKGKQIKINR